ncbi:MAG TPA: helix-turn-helix transcriptional regulator [Nocardioidaceae bacterium]|jgi:transcriptional regulator with XRE-family HTH domain|nr:helix-turn-helix transcriptional regulator [Nocardioidaceae bacterium]
MVALREVLGEVLRSHRMRRGLTLRQVSADARISLGYISEVERGQKEASSELIAALCTALDVPLSQVLGDASEQMLVVEQGADALPARVSDLPVRNVATSPVVAAA